MRFTIRQVDITDLLVQNAIYSMVTEVFPPGSWDAAPRFTQGYWWVAYHNGDAVAFAGMVDGQQDPNSCYMCAAGVLKAYRGHGLQKRLIKKRIDYARKIGKTSVVTETINDNVASMNSLISCGFRTYTPRLWWGSSYSVFWKKDL